VSPDNVDLSRGMIIETLRPSPPIFAQKAIIRHLRDKNTRSYAMVFSLNF
jgi:hypothetical protein